MSTSPNSLLAMAQRASVAITGKRFCSSHMGDAEVDKGSFIDIRGGRRWCCFNCQEKRKPSK